MEPLELSYGTQDAIPEAFRPLYVETDGKFNLTHINGMKTQEDINKLQEGNRKEREDHAATKASLKLFGDLKPKETFAALDKIEEYKLAADGKLDEDKIASIVESRLAQKTGPLERQVTDLTTERDKWKLSSEGLQGSIDSREMGDAVGSIARTMKVHESAIGDVMMVAKTFIERDPDSGKYIVKGDANGVTPGLDIKGFMKEMQTLRPYWWPESEGGGNRGGGGDYGGDKNPFTHNGWNLTEQGKIVTAQGMVIADGLAKAAGTTVGGLQPPAPK